MSKSKHTEADGHCAEAGESRRKVEDVAREYEFRSAPWLKGEVLRHG